MMQHKSSLNSEPQAPTDNSEQGSIQSDMNSNRKQGTYSHNISGTRPSTADQNPYYVNPTDNPTMNLTTQNPYIRNSTNPSATDIRDSTSSNNGFNTGDFVKGALIGAAVTYLMTNKNIQNALFKTVAKTTTMFQAGMEEAKERFEDAKAEIQAENQAD